MSDIAVTALLGKTITNIAGMTEGSESISIDCSDGTSYVMYHEQDCCESVFVNDVAGDPADLIGSPIVNAEESASSDRPEGMPAPDSYVESETWTFYRLGTVKGTVVLRWLGSSNGYYSESVTFRQTK